MSLNAANDYLGWTFIDIVTGFKGVATGYVSYLTGCDQVALNPGMLPDGKMGEAYYFDVTRLKLIPKVERIVMNKKASAKPGGPNLDCPKH